MRQINPLWKLDINSIRNFLYPALRKAEKSEDSFKKDNQNKKDLDNS